MVRGLRPDRVTVTVVGERDYANGTGYFIYTTSGREKAEGLTGGTAEAAGRQF